MKEIARAARRYLLVRTIAGGIWAVTVVAVPLAIVMTGQGEVSITWDMGGRYG